MSEYSNQANILADNQQVASPIETHPMYRDEYMRNRAITAPKTINYNNEEDKTDILLIKYVGAGVTLVNLISENIISHPFQILRRQCQINPSSRKYHLTPFTLIPTIYHLHHHQGLTILWKGLGSTLIVRGITLGIEDLLSKSTPWPKEISASTKFKDFLRHLLLKSTTLIIITPFYCASFVETVQSDVASEKPKIFDVFKEGVMRLFNWGGSYQGRMLPIWVLVVSTVTLGLTKYLFTLTTKFFTYRLLNKINNKSKQHNKTYFENNLELKSNFISKILCDLLFYPCDTIIYRLYLQGSRTIVDNLDDGRSVLPILTNYTGTIDCYENCVNNEGKFGLYKGFGALILQYTVHCGVVQFAKFIFTEIVQLIYRKKIEKQQLIKPISPDIVSHLTATQHSYLLP